MRKAIIITLAAAGAALGLAACGAPVAITTAHAETVSQCPSAGADGHATPFCRVSTQGDDHKTQDDESKGDDNSKTKGDDKAKDSDGDHAEDVDHDADDDKDGHDKGDKGDTSTPKASPHPVVEVTPPTIPQTCDCHSSGPVHITGPVSVTLPAPKAVTVPSSGTAVTTVPDTGTPVPWGAGAALIALGGLTAGAARRLRRP